MSDDTLPSSEDLIRRAREELARSDPISAPAQPSGAATDDAASESAASEDAAAQDAAGTDRIDFPVPSLEEPEWSEREEPWMPDQTRRVEPLEAPVATGELETRPSRAPDSGQSPTLPAGYGDDGTVNEHRSALPVLVATAGVVLLVIAGLAVAALVAASPASPTASLAPGDCLRAPESSQIVDVDQVHCDEPHEFEVMGAVSLEDGPYPGDQDAFAMALFQCEPLYVDYLGVGYPEPPWYMNVFTPSEEAWDGGERRATCLLFRYTDDLSDFATVEGSARSTG